MESKIQFVFRGGTYNLMWIGFIAMIISRLKFGQLMLSKSSPTSKFHFRHLLKLLLYSGENRYQSTWMMRFSNFMRPRPRSGRGLTKSLRYSKHTLFNAGVSRFSAGGVGGWLQSLFKAGVSRFSAVVVGGWLRSLLKAGVSRFNAGGVGD